MNDNVLIIVFLIYKHEDLTPYSTSSYITADSVTSPMQCTLTSYFLITVQLCDVTALTAVVTFLYRHC